MTYKDEDLLPLSGLQHFAFCRRQWALIHVEHQWQENLRTIEGSLLHQRAHNERLRERPGRTSLALDLMEELRPCMADRFVLTLINNRIIGKSDFDCRENGTVFLTDSGRKSFLQHWQERKREQLTHPYLQEKLPWGLVPYTQALLLARYLRGDLDAYPPFLWK